MPYKPMRPCRQFPCPNLTSNPSGYCDTHKIQAQQIQDRQRGSANERGYTAQWQKARKVFLSEHPLCAICQRKNPPEITSATLVDHIKPHKGDPDLFWDESNWQSACKPCHDEKTAREDGAFGNKTI